MLVSLSKKDLAKIPSILEVSVHLRGKWWSFPGHVSMRVHHEMISIWKATLKKAEGLSVITRDRTTIKS